MFLNRLLGTLGGAIGQESTDEVVSNQTETEFWHCSGIGFRSDKTIKINTEVKYMKLKIF